MDRVGLRARFQLVIMANHALDRPRGDNPARVYWGGHRLLATEIYGPHEWGQNAGARTGIKRAIRELLKAGLIRVYVDTPGGVTAYEILPPGGVHGEPH